MSFVKRLKVLAFVGVLFMLSIAILVAGSIIGAILSVLIIIALVFTGLWLSWFVTKDFSEAKNENG